MLFREDSGSLISHECGSIVHDSSSNIQNDFESEPLFPHLQNEEGFKMDDNPQQSINMIDEAQNVQNINNQNEDQKSNPSLDKIEEELNKILVEKENKNPKKNKLHHKRTKQSIRNGNQLTRIKGNLIQKHILDWLNDGKSPEHQLKKIDPDLLKSKYAKISDILQISLSELYSNDICKKYINENENINKDHNKNIINNLEKNDIMSTKLAFKFKNVLKIFFNIDDENNLLIDENENILKGMINFKEYFEKTINSNNTFNKKLIKNLKKVADLIFKNSKLSEVTTKLTNEEK